MSLSFPSISLHAYGNKFIFFVMAAYYFSWRINHIYLPNSLLKDSYLGQFCFFLFFYFFGIIDNTVVCMCLCVLTKRYFVFILTQSNLSERRMGLEQYVSYTIYKQAIASKDKFINKGKWVHEFWSKCTIVWTYILELFDCCTG